MGLENNKAHYHIWLVRLGTLVKEGREKGAKINWNKNRSQIEIQVKMLMLPSETFLTIDKASEFRLGLHNILQKCMAKTQLNTHQLKRGYDCSGKHITQSKYCLA